MSRSKNRSFSVVWLLVAAQLACVSCATRLPKGEQPTGSYHYVTGTGERRFGNLVKLSEQEGQLQVLRRAVISRQVSEEEMTQAQYVISYNPLYDFVEIFPGVFLLFTAFLADIYPPHKACVFHNEKHFLARSEQMARCIAPGIRGHPKSRSHAALVEQARVEEVGEKYWREASYRRETEITFAAVERREIFFTDRKERVILRIPRSGSFDLRRIRPLLDKELEFQEAANGAWIVPLTSALEGELRDAR